MSEKVTASFGIAVDGQEFGALLKRFRHLLESETIRKYDEVNPRTGEYVRDIKELDKIVGVDIGSGEDKTAVHYLCDHRACERCSNTCCDHTKDIRHAKNFENVNGVFVECERDCNAEKGVQP